MINTLKHKLHLLAIKRQWYGTVYTGKTTIHKTIFGTFFTATNYISRPLNALIKSEVERSVTDAKSEFVESYLREKERAATGERWEKQLEAIQDFTKLNIKGILPD